MTFIVIIENMMNTLMEPLLLFNKLTSFQWK